MWGLMILSYICILVALLLLFLSALQGYFQFQIFQAYHSQFALFSTVFYMFTETLIMFYFIGSGTAIKKTIQTTGISTGLYDKVKKTKMKLFPHLTLNMILIGTVFILGGAVQTGRISGWIHGLLFDFTFIHLIYTTYQQHLGFKGNVEIIEKISISQTTMANGSPS